jgi:hypothetical protein
LTEEQYDELRHLSDSQFRMQLKQAKKIAGKEGWLEFWESWKILLIVMIGCAALGTIFDSFRKVSGIFETIASIFGIIFALALFGTLYSSLLSISSSSRFVSELGKYLKSQRKSVLLSGSYSNYVTIFREELKKRTRRG